GILFTFFVFFRAWIMARFTFPLLRVANRTVHIVLDDFGLHTQVDEIENRMPWSEIRRFVQTSEALFLFIWQKQAFIIPLRAVENAAKLAELAGAIRSKLPDQVPR